MYIERKGDDSEATPARIGRVRFSKSGRSVHYDGRTFQALAGRGVEGNYLDTDAGDEYWISGCKKDGSDPLFSKLVVIDDDVREEYWSAIRNLPESKDRKSFKAIGKHSR